MGGGDFHVVKNWELFVARLSGFWLGKMLLGRSEKENVSRQKKMEGMNGPDPLLTLSTNTSAPGSTTSLILGTIIEPTPSVIGGMSAPFHTAPTILMRSPSTGTISTGISMAAAAVEAILEAHKDGTDNNIFLYQTPDLAWIPSTFYRYNDLLDGLRVRHNNGIGNNFFYMGDDSSMGHHYGLINIAAFLAQFMKETIQYNASVNQTPESYFMTKVKSSKHSLRPNWMAVSKHWYNLEIDTNKHEDLNLMFANHREEDAINHLTTIEIAEAQQKDGELKVYTRKTQKHLKRTYVFSLLKTQKCYVRMTI
jgi:hypothetical protein